MLCWTDSFTENEKVYITLVPSPAPEDMVDGCWFRELIKTQCVVNEKVGAVGTSKLSFESV